MKIDRGMVESGPAVLTIRPEAIELGENSSNSFEAKVISKVYMGTQVRVHFDVKGLEIEGLFPKETMSAFQDGRSLNISFPAKTIWAVPDEA